MAPCRQSELCVAVAFLVACHAGGTAHPPQPLVGISLPPSSTATPTPTAASPSRSTGAAEAQAAATSGPDDRENATNAVARANAQIDRLRRMQRAPVHENADSLDASLDDLERARRNVLQDLREIELEPPGAVIRRELQRDLGDLQRAVDASYKTWPPTGQEVRRSPPR